MKFTVKWQGWQDSNPRHAVLETAVLPTELHPYLIMVEGVGFEPTKLPQRIYSPPHLATLVPLRILLEPPAGIEPATSSLRVMRTTDCAKVAYNMSSLERVKGIEPSTRAWEALVLPLNYTRKWWLGTESNRRHEDFQSSALPTELPSQNQKQIL
jgi:hypothetical protein